MTTKSKKSFLDKWMSVTPVLFITVLMMILAFLLIGQQIYPDERDMMVTECQTFDAQWQQVLENGERVDVTVPGQIPAKWGEVVTLTTTLPDEVHNGESICFRTIWQDVDIYVDGELRVSYSTENSRPFGKNSAFRCLFLRLTGEDSGKELTYSFSSESKYAGTMRTAYIGQESSIWFYLVEEFGAKALISVFLLLVSLFCIVACLILRYVYKKMLPLSYLAWTLFLCALWMMSEIEFRQIIFRNVSVLTNGTYWCLMLIAYPMIIYMNEIQDRTYSKMYSIISIYTTAVFAVGTFLQVFDIVQFVQQLPFVHVGIGACILAILGSITYDTFNGRIKNYLAVGIGIYGMLLSAVLEIVLYYINVELSLGTVLAIGLLFLLVMAIVKTGQDLMDSEKKKQQAIMAKEAQAKFLANMSHEIRTPINAVIGMNEMILRENQDETVHEYAQNIQSASSMLLELVNDILDFSKIESGQLELVDEEYYLATVIQDEKLLLNARVTGKPISTLIEVDPQIPSKLLGDKLRVKQILTNLLSNGVKYTQRGNVTLKVSYEWIDAEHISLIFAVADTGRGIKEEDIPQLFDKFKRLDLNENHNVEGTGLGLNIVKQLVEQMQGSIKVESEYGKGSVFTVNIPQKVVDKNAIGNFEQAVRECRKENQTAESLFTAPDASVLVVDDNRMNLNLMKALIKRTKMQIELASSGAECLELTRRKKFDIILMDHMMPQMDGVDTLKALRAESNNVNRNTVVVALTANAIAGSREMYLGYGFDDYLSKPIQADKLDELLGHLLPSGLVKYEKLDVEKKTEDSAVSTEHVEPISEKPVEEGVKVMVREELLDIDSELGLQYCLNMVDFYKDTMKDFCEQVREYQPELAAIFEQKDWKRYAMVAHALKGNAKNIGAVAFSDLSLQHEKAAKEGNEAFILNEYRSYMDTLQKLLEKVEKLSEA